MMMWGARVGPRNYLGMPVPVLHFRTADVRWITPPQKMALFWGVFYADPIRKRRESTKRKKKRRRVKRKGKKRRIYK